MKKKHKGALGIALLLPIIIIMAVLVYYPIIKTFSYSLQKMKLTAPQDTGFVGLANYRSVLESDSFWYSLQNTLFLLVVVVLFTTVFGICVALMLNVDTKISGLLMAAAVLPWALPPVVNGIIWRFIFYPGYGFMNKLLIGLGVIDQPIEWMSHRFLLLFVVAVVVAWRSIPFTAIVCLAGLRAIPHEFYEAARIDGAGRWSSFRYITGPLMLPFIGIGITSASITAINIFDEIVALAGYSDLGKNLLIESYLTTFSFLDFGKGSALTYIIMLISAILGFFYLRNLTREVEY
ncbi:sugar ABC transporter permease [Faecalicatena sp. AGMB00832]|uniref:Sugar ABC transporter permease n=1 Tax=Faecalicatena faecalis TaxID=2726362 RepID=A0ABS6D989_9FIRM|nr:sugar ABC transporter permease [Faecalicatena faecalis]MBU3877691.1 sugar ABC transporter permease [Faecalicatena faecalis]